MSNLASPQPLAAIDSKSRRERVITAVREAIINADFKPGQPLIETELAEQLGTSRAPVREALQHLHAEGLVEIVPYHGARVRALHRRDIEELYSLRTVLETFAARLIIEHDGERAAESVADLRAVFIRMLAAAEAGDLDQVSRIDREFHDALIAGSGHKLLGETWSAVSLRVRHVMAQRNRLNSDICQIAYNHLPIIEAIETGDLSRVTVLLEKHIASARDLLVKTWDTGELQRVPGDGR